MRHLPRSTSWTTAVLVVLVTVVSGCSGGTAENSTGNSNNAPAPAPAPSPSPPPAPGPGSFSVNLVWDSPTDNTDQSCLTDLSSYVLSYGTAPGIYDFQEALLVDGVNCIDTGTASSCGNIFQVN